MTKPPEVEAMPYPAGADDHAHARDRLDPTPADRHEALAREWDQLARDPAPEAAGEETADVEDRHPRPRPPRTADDRDQARAGSRTTSSYTTVSANSEPDRPPTPHRARAALRAVTDDQNTEHSSTSRPAEPQRGIRDIEL